MNMPSDDENLIRITIRVAGRDPVPATLTVHEAKRLRDFLARRVSEIERSTETMMILDAPA